MLWSCRTWLPTCCLEKQNLTTRTKVMSHLGLVACFSSLLLVLAFFSLSQKEMSSPHWHFAWLCKTEAELSIQWLCVWMLSYPAITVISGPSFFYYDQAGPLWNDLYPKTKHRTAYHNWCVLIFVPSSPTILISRKDWGSSHNNWWVLLLPCLSPLLFQSWLFFSQGCDFPLNDGPATVILSIFFLMTHHRQ